jgi:2-keto-4-pentenoate hydratase/2-oxohepta-3-ene-1,7-dioic acid hydratase in catechol pathway
LRDSAPSVTAAHADELQRFYREIDALNLAALWESLHDLVTQEPVTPVVPVLWDSPLPLTLSTPGYNWSSRVKSPGPTGTRSRPCALCRNDHEIELVVVIGREGRHIPQSHALEYIAGYAVGLDKTVRGPEDRSLRKSPDTFSVLGLWLTTRDEIPDPNNLAVSLHVNGVLRQQATTRDLIFGVQQLIEFASTFYRLHSGDLIYTGTSEGVGPVVAGDVMTCTIHGLGTMVVAVARR